MVLSPAENYRLSEEQAVPAKEILKPAGKEEREPAEESYQTALESYCSKLSQQKPLEYEQLLVLAKRMDDARQAWRSQLFTAAHYLSYPALYCLEEKLRNKKGRYEKILENTEGRHKSRNVLPGFYDGMARIRKIARKLPFPVAEKQRHYSRPSQDHLQESATITLRLPLRSEWWKQLYQKILGDFSLPLPVQQQLQENYQQHQQAQQAIVEGNLRLVFKVARKFQGWELADLIQEGNIGLIKAADRYDYRRGYRFSTYATWWIRHTIQRYLTDRGRIVRDPVYVDDARRRVRRASRQLYQQRGQAPEQEELAEAADLSLKQLQRLQNTLEFTFYSLEDRLHEDSLSWEELLADETVAAPEERIAVTELQAELGKALTTLTLREEQVLRERAGLGLSERHLEGYTLQEVGKHLGLTRERIRQIEDKAKGKVRRSAEKRLKEFL